MSPRPQVAAVALSILGEYRGLLFVDKPAGLQTEPDAQHSDTLVTRVASQLALPSADVHALSRLDTGVSGVVTLGLSGEARRLATEWRARGLFRRRYVALAAGDVAVRSGSWSESIGRAAGSLRRVAGRHAEPAHTDFTVVSSSVLRERATPSRAHLLALSPVTGRTHQLRVHSAGHGLPLLGDRGYGGLSRVTSATGAVHALDRILLHAAWVELPLPEPRRITAVIPAAMRALWRDLGGDEGAFEAALTASVSV